MELVERAVLDLNPPPDRRLGFEQRDLELVETLRGRNRADAFGFFEGFGDGIDDMPQRVSDHAGCRHGDERPRPSVSNRFEFFGREGDRAGVLLVELQAVGELGQQIGDDFALGLGEEDVDWRTLTSVHRLFASSFDLLTLVSECQSLAYASRSLRASAVFDDKFFDLGQIDWSQTDLTKCLPNTGSVTSILASLASDSSSDKGCCSEGAYDG